MHPSSVLHNATSQQSMVCSRLLAVVSAAPTVATTGYCSGAFLINTGGSASTGGSADIFYVNKGAEGGTAADPNWGSVYTHSL